MIEDIIYNLANNIDIIETNRMIADYKESNKNFIGKNRQKTNRELLELEDILSEEKKQNQARRQLDLRLDKVRVWIELKSIRIAGEKEGANFWSHPTWFRGSLIKSSIIIRLDQSVKSCVSQVTISFSSITACYSTAGSEY